MFSHVILFIPLGKSGINNFKKIYDKLYDNFLFKIVVGIYDDLDLTKEIQDVENNKYITWFYSKGQKWQFIYNHLNPNNKLLETAKLNYNPDYILLWDDDLTICDNFDFNDFMNIVKKNNLEVFQPSFTSNSITAHNVVYKDEKYQHCGRRTNFVEIMCPGYSWPAYNKLFQYISEKTIWGWGVDFIPWTKIGIVDKYTVAHTRPIRSNAFKEMQDFFKKHKLSYYKGSTVESLKEINKDEC